MRQIILDTETTGIDPRQGHKIIEIGCVEIVNRKHTNKHYHQYINPEREIEAEAMAIHGITNERVADEPVFAEVVDEFMNFVKGAELVIHNAPFDVGFINHELSLLPDNKWGKLEDHCTITDSLAMARRTYPGQPNSLDALCRRLGIDNSNRVLHGALLDSEILADVYLTMTGGQVGLELQANQTQKKNIWGSRKSNSSLKIIKANEEELTAHKDFLANTLKGEAW